MRTELALTYISPKPYLVKDSLTGIDLCFWNGVCLTRNYGRAIAAEIWCNLYQSEIVKEALYQEHVRAYYAGAFKTDKWDANFKKQTSQTMYTLLKSYLSKNNSTVNKKQYDGNFLVNLKNQYTAQEALSWFEKDRVAQDEV